jgi:hypothetical protein
MPLLARTSVVVSVASGGMMWCPTGTGLWSLVYRQRPSTGDCAPVPVPGRSVGPAASSRKGLSRRPQTRTKACFGLAISSSRLAISSSRPNVMTTAVQRPAVPALDLTFLNSPAHRPRPQPPALVLASMMPSPDAPAVRMPSPPRLKLARPTASRWAPADLPPFQPSPLSSTTSAHIDLSASGDFSIVELPSSPRGHELWSDQDEGMSSSSMESAEEGRGSVERGALAGKENGRRARGLEAVRGLVASAAVLLVVVVVVVVALRLSGTTSSSPT